MHNIDKNYFENCGWLMLAVPVHYLGMTLQKSGSAYGSLPTFCHRTEDDQPHMWLMFVAVVRFSVCHAKLPENIRPA
jgi:hypothetical protein